MITAMLLALLLTSCCPVSNFVATHKAEIAGEVAFAALTTLDGIQTSHITRYCSESNPILGLCGQRVPVAVYFPALVGLHAAGAIVLPEEYRAWWVGVPLGLEAGVVWETFALGWRP